MQRPLTSGMRFNGHVLLIGVLATATCRSDDLNLPKGSTSFAPPAVYSTWWGMVQSCSGRSGELSRVAWFEAPDNASLRVNNQSVAGYWDSVSNSIVVKHSAKHDGSLVRHEMLHGLSQSTSHSRVDFLERCGGVVACLQECLTDAGDFRAPVGTAMVPPDSLDISAEIEPLATGGTVADSFFRLTVSVRNPAARPIVVAFPSSGDAGPSLAFSYRIVGTTSLEYNDRVWDSEIGFFRPAETKRRVFDLVVRPKLDMSFAILPGTYQVWGGFGERLAQPLKMVIP